jgi:hypothetical protein
MSDRRGHVPFSFFRYIRIWRAPHEDEVKLLQPQTRTRTEIISRAMLLYWFSHSAQCSHAQRPADKSRAAVRDLSPLSRRLLFILSSFRMSGTGLVLPPTYIGKPCWLASSKLLLIGLAAWPIFLQVRLALPASWDSPLASALQPGPRCLCLCL